jgi:hypothetical protein
MRNYELMSGFSPAGENENLHGPCHNFTILSQEYDFALCFYSRHWPLPALPWVDRCLTRAWPSCSALQAIIDDGFHLVPIAHRQTNENSDLEWRISFSQTEQKLVYSMNHCQFLCYGIMKIILKEVICDELLCSYFMKTILFWRIQKSSLISWVPSTLLQHVWFCFKSLMQCVYTGYLPNFFIPENNMFAGKVIGAQQMSLYQKLESFYEIGVAFLLHSPTLREILIPALSDPRFVMPTGESFLKSEIDIDIALYIESQTIQTMTSIFGSADFLSSMAYLNVIDQLVTNHYSVIHNDALVGVLLLTSMSLKTQCLCGSNKSRHTIDRTIIHMLGLVTKLGCVSDGLYLALYLFDTGRYQTALTVTDRVKQRLLQPHVLSYTVDRQRYSEAVGGQSLLTKYRKAWVRNVRFDGKFSYIEELRLEQEVSKSKGLLGIFLPPFVAVHMLSVLCHYRQGNRPQYLQALTDLHTLLLYDDGRYVPLPFRDISWQILGICQHVVGDLPGALRSYQESLRQLPRHKIQTATETRIDFVSKQLSGTTGMMI